MNKVQKIKYYSYIIIGAISFIVLSTKLLTTSIRIWMLGLLIISIIGILYSILCLRSEKNVFDYLPKICLYVFRGFVIVGLISFLIVESAIIYHGTQQSSVEPDYIIVLGAAIKDDGPSKALKYRLDAAYDVYLKYPDVKIICSGGKAENENYSEAQVMKTYLMELGVDVTSILIEDKSVNTQENLNNSKKIISNREAKVLIITNNFHSFRAEFMAKRLKLDAYSYPAQGLLTTFPMNYTREYFSIIKTLILD